MLGVQTIAPPTSNPNALQALHDYCTNLTAHGAGDDIVMVTDAFDVIIRGPPQAILDRYNETVGGKRSAAHFSDMCRCKTSTQGMHCHAVWHATRRMVLVSAEVNCFPSYLRACQNESVWYTKNRPTNTSYKFLNSGGYIGPANLLLLILNSAINFSNPHSYQQEDQGVWQVLTRFVEQHMCGHVLTDYPFSLIHCCRKFLLTAHTKIRSCLIITAQFSRVCFMQSITWHADPARGGFLGKLKGLTVV